MGSLQRRPSNSKGWELTTTTTTQSKKKLATATASGTIIIAAAATTQTLKNIRQPVREGCTSVGI